VGPLVFSSGPSGPRQGGRKVLPYVASWRVFIVGAWGHSKRSGPGQCPGVAPAKWLIYKGKIGLGPLGPLGPLILEGVPVLCAEQESNTGRKARQCLGLREIRPRRRNRPSRNHVRRRIDPAPKWVPHHLGDFFPRGLCIKRRMEGRSAAPEGACAGGLRCRARARRGRRRRRGALVEPRRRRLVLPGYWWAAGRCLCGWWAERPRQARPVRPGGGAERGCGWRVSGRRKGGRVPAPSLPGSAS
jgi:hypothetical protein